MEGIVTFFLGGLCGACLGALFVILIINVFDEREQDSEPTIQTATPLLPAKANKEIASISAGGDTSERGQVLNKIVELINAAAQEGATRLYINRNLNEKVEKYLTKRDIIRFFDRQGYSVTFKYEFLDESDIAYISWD